MDPGRARYGSLPGERRWTSVAATGAWLTIGRCGNPPHVQALAWVPPMFPWAETTCEGRSRLGTTTVRRIHRGELEMLRRAWVSLVIAVLALTAVFATAGASSGEDALPASLRTISVNGDGAASAVPDIADIELGVQTIDEDPTVAIVDNTTAMANVIETLIDLDIDEDDIRTLTFNMWVEQGVRSRRTDRRIPVPRCQPDPGAGSGPGHHRRRAGRGAGGRRQQRRRHPVRRGGHAGAGRGGAGCGRG